MSKIIIFVLLIAITLAGCTTTIKSPGTENLAQNSSSQGGISFDNINLVQFDRPETGDKVAIIRTNMGEFRVMLFPDHAPKAVENFVTHAQNGYYNGLTFYMAVNGRAVYTGDPLGTGSGGASIWGGTFENEFSADLWHFRGAVSMLSRGPNTNGSSFFIVQANEVPDYMLEQMTTGGFPAVVTQRYSEVGGAPWLDFNNTIFGQVYVGMDVIDSIAAAAVDADYRPLSAIIIESITIIRAE